MPTKAEGRPGRGRGYIRFRTRRHIPNGVKGPSGPCTANTAQCMRGQGADTRPGGAPSHTTYGQAISFVLAQVQHDHWRNLLQKNLLQASKNIDGQVCTL